MSLIHLNTEQKNNNLPVLNLGFRPFFLGAGIFAVLAIAIWFLFYTLNFNPPINHINTYQWHAHEMIYGYSLAVIAGFVLAATKNWTSMQTLHGIPLLLLFFLWLVARIFILLGLNLLAGISDLLFVVMLNFAVAVPIIKAKQWRQLAVLSKLLAFGIFNFLFYLGALNLMKNGVYLGIYGGFYLVIGLILMMGRRVIPFFIERGVANGIKLYNSKILDFASLVLFICFFIAEMLRIYPQLSAYSSLFLGIVNIFRLIGWHTRGLWKQPLLWSIYLAIWSISLGFILYYFSYVFGLSKFIAIHTLAYGGIGMITIGMMSRVALGHSGRSIHDVPAGIQTACLLLFTGMLFRVLIPILFPMHYMLWIGVAMIFWIIAFSIFCYRYIPILTRKRIDGLFG